MATTVKVIEILGPGCARCHEARRVVQYVVDEAKLECQVTTETSLERMIQLGILSTPAVLFDGKVVLSGKTPKSDEVRRLLGVVQPVAQRCRLARPGNSEGGEGYGGDDKKRSDRDEGA